MPRLSIPGARALALLSLLLLSGCSRAEKPQPEAPSVPTPPPASVTETGTHAPAAEEPAAAVPAPSEAPVLVASAPHPTEGTNNPDAVIRSPVPAPSGTTVRLLLPEGQNPPWLADALAKAAGAKVEVKTYATDAEAVALLGAAPDAARSEPFPDLVSLSDRAAAELVPRNALHPLPAEATKGMTAPAPEFLRHYFDNKSVYTWPYGFTLLGLGTVAPADPKAFVPRTWHDLARVDVSLSLPADPQLKGALWALAEAKPALSDLPPEPWRNAPYEASPVSPAPGKAWVDALPRLRAVRADRWTVTVPSEGSIIFLYHWAVPAAADPSPAAVAALRALLDPALAARLDGDAGLAATQPAAKGTVPADPAATFRPHTLQESRFVHAAPRAEAVSAAAK